MIIASTIMENIIYIYISTFILSTVDSVLELVVDDMLLIFAHLSCSVSWSPIVVDSWHKFSSLMTFGSSWLKCVHFITTAPQTTHNMWQLYNLSLTGRPMRTLGEGILSYIWDAYYRFSLSGCLIVDPLSHSCSCWSILYIYTTLQ